MEKTGALGYAEETRKETTIHGVRMPPPRLLLILLCVAAVVAGCAKSPFTGRNQFMMITEDQERAMGHQASQQYKRQYKIIDEGPAVERITEVGLRIAAATRRPDMSWEFLLVDNDTVQNAFALPGGKIFVYTGLLKLARTDAELATVMAHEVAHILARHGAERMSTEMLISLGAQAGAAAIQIGDPYTAQVFSQAYGLGVNVGVVLPFSRHMEEEADYIGLILMAKAGYDPAAAVNFWEKMAEAKDGEPPTWLSTHPTSADRIEDIKRSLPAVKELYWNK